MAAPKSRAVFSMDKDIAILREVVYLNPFDKQELWEEITSKINDQLVYGKAYSTRAIRDRINHLMKKFKSDDQGKRKRSGTEEEIREYEQLLQETMDLYNECRGQKKAKANSFQLDLQAHDDSAYQHVIINCKEEAISPNSSPASSTYTELQPSPATLSRPTQQRIQDACVYCVRTNGEWREWIEQERMDLLKREQTLKEQQLALETRKFEFEREMREKDLELRQKESAFQEKERLARIACDGVSLQLMQALIKKVDDKK